MSIQQSGYHRNILTPQRLFWQRMGFQQRPDMTPNMVRQPEMTTKATCLLIAAVATCLFMGCKSASPHAANTQGAGRPPQPASATQIETSNRYPGTNIFYKFECGPGCATFVLETDYKSTHITGGTRVVVIDGHFPSPAEMPASPAMSTYPVIPRTQPPQPLDLIDTDYKPAPVDIYK